MKQTVYKIILLTTALIIIVVAVALMVKTATATAPMVPEPDSVLSYDADSLATCYLQGGDTEDFNRAIDFIMLCRRENQIPQCVYDRNAVSVVTDSAQRTYNKIFSRLEGRWNYSDLTSAISLIRGLKSYKLSDGETIAMGREQVARLDMLQSYASEYAECNSLYSRRLGGNVSSENARRIIDEAEAYLRIRSLLGRNIQISEKRLELRTRLTREHSYYIMSKIEEIADMSFSGEDELTNYIRNIAACINDYKSGIENRTYDSSGSSTESLRSSLAARRDAKREEIRNRHSGIQINQMQNTGG